MYMPEMLRVRGEVLLSLKAPDLVTAENCFLQSIELAQRQAALSFELSAAVSLSRLWLWQGRREEAHGLLAPIYERFTEGFDTHTLQVARELLHEFGSPGETK